MRASTENPIVPYTDPEWIPVHPTRWVAEYDGEVAGSIDRTPRGKYRATDRNGRSAGTHRTLVEARDALEAKNSTTTIQRMNESHVLLYGGLFAFLAAATVATIGIVSLLSQ